MIKRSFRIFKFVCFIYFIFIFRNESKSKREKQLGANLYETLGILEKFSEEERQCEAPGWEGCEIPTWLYRKGAFWISAEEGRIFLQLSPRIGTHPKTCTVSLAPGDNCEIGEVIISIVIVAIPVVVTVLRLPSKLSCCLISSYQTMWARCGHLHYPSSGLDTVSVERVIQGKSKIIPPYRPWAPKAKAAPNHTSCQPRMPTSRKRERSQQIEEK